MCTKSDKINLVVIPFHDWKKCEHEGFRTRDAHFMQEFGKHPQINKVLIVNRPTSLPEMLLLRKNWHITEGNSIYATRNMKLSQVDDKSYTVDTRVLDTWKPLIQQRKWLPSAYGNKKLVHNVESALSTLDMRQNYALFMSAPLFVPLVKQLTPKVIAFDAQDNLMKHSLYRNVPNLLSYYDYCMKYADIITANSMETTQWFALKNDNATHIGNGVSLTFFDSTKEYMIPDDLRNIPRPIVGYAGKMQDMFDVTLMCKTVESMTDVSFVFIGQQLNSKWMKPLWRYPNVYYLGDKRYYLLPSYLAAFDVCIIPYRPDKQHGGDPIKFYEYLAMQKPIVTTDIGDVSKFRSYPNVRIANTAKQFSVDLKSLLKSLGSSKSTAGYELPTEILWSSKADYIIGQIYKKLA